MAANNNLFQFAVVFLLCGLATYYAATAMVDSGAFNIFDRMRLPIAKHFQIPYEAKYGNARNQPIHWLWKLFTCPKCLSIYIAIVPTAIFLTPVFNLDLFQSGLVIFALAGMSRLLYSFEM